MANSTMNRVAREVENHLMFWGHRFKTKEFNDSFTITFECSDCEEDYKVIIMKDRRNRRKKKPYQSINKECSNSGSPAGPGTG